jgi:hypothetical protein
VTRAPRSLAQGLALAALLAASGAPIHAAQAAAELPDTRQNEAWSERVAEARADIDSARERRDAAETAVDRMRHRRHPRGAAREGLFSEREVARAGVVEAERALDELLEQARRAGVPPGWLRAPEPALPAAPE